jgi:Family of unknown function (DUF6364)
MKRMAKVTLTLEADLLREARILAAAEGKSLSGLIRARLEELVRRSKAYDAAQRRALARLRAGHDLQSTPSASRDGLHER